MNASAPRRGEGAPRTVAADAELRPVTTLQGVGDALAVKLAKLGVEWDETQQQQRLVIEGRPQKAGPRLLRAC